jgi:16S rRNA (uracil1498-N3)-methyltransferase
VVGGTVSLDDDERHHLQVRRVVAGTEVSFTDGAGVRGTGELAAMGRGFDLAIASIESVPAPAPLALAVGAGDRDRFGWLVEKATELGVTEIIPLETERTRGVATGLKPAHVDKLRRRSREVLKQCGGAWVPAVRDPVPLDVFLQRPTAGARWLLDARGASVPALDDGRPACALVGPEGGLTETERSAVLAQGFIPVCAGPLTLRFETAAIAAAVLIQAARRS